MLVAYSRDSMSAPLRQLEVVLLAIRRSRFFPDSSRSGYIKGIDEDHSPTEVATEPIMSAPADVGQGSVIAPATCRDAGGERVDA
eukprot:1864865-Amphidinium_carterae.1